MSPILFGTIRAIERIGPARSFSSPRYFLFTFGTKAAAYRLQAHKWPESCHFGSCGFLKSYASDSERTTIERQCSRGLEVLSPPDPTFGTLTRHRLCA